MHQIKLDDLVPLGGGWAMRSIYDMLTETQLQGEEIEVLPLLEKACKTASGYSSVRYYQKILQLSNIESSKAPGLPVEKYTFLGMSKLPLLTKLPSDQSELSPHYWVTRLSDQLNASPGKKLTDRIRKIQSEDSHAFPDTKNLIEGWCFPFLCELLSYDNKSDYRINIIIDELLTSRWRHWYHYKHKAPILIVSPNMNGFSLHQWFTCCIVHNGAHLFHLIRHPTACNTYSIPSLAIMEGFAMYIERSLLKCIENGYRIESQLPGFCTEKIKTFLLLGLYERAARIYYDTLVHIENIPIQTWLTEYVPNLGINLSLYDFSYEFHGLPGLASSYMLGMKTLQTFDIKKIITGGHEDNFVLKMAQVAAYEL